MASSKLLQQQVPQPPIARPQHPANNNYWFALGHQPLLSLVEIENLYNTKHKIYNRDNHLAIFNLKNFNPKNAIFLLGGTIKIAQEMGTDLTDGSLKEKIINELKNISGKIHFGLSYYGSKFNLKDVQRFGIQLKTELKQEGYSVRFVQNKDIFLSSATVKNNKLDKKGRDFLIYEEGNKYNLAVTQAVQPFDKFSQRDYGRPGRDDFSGMLPPKLAMMMINLSQTGPTDVILDPFCGSGTILSEAILMGYKNLIGLDISKKAIDDTKKNIEWTIKNYKLNIKNYTTRIEQYDVKNISDQLGLNSINAIITEPYLGKPLKGRESKEELEKQINELKKLYLSAFIEFEKTLKPNGIVVFIIPRFKCKNDWITIDILSEIKRLGFKPEPLLPNHNYLLYHRPNQFVGREIWRFKKV